jgi:hypothetical protein
VRPFDRFDSFAKLNVHGQFGEVLSTVAYKSTLSRFAFEDPGFRFFAVRPVLLYEKRLRWAKRCHVSCDFSRKLQKFFESGDFGRKSGFQTLIALINTAKKRDKAGYRSLPASGGTGGRRKRDGGDQRGQTRITQITLLF